MRLLVCALATLGFLLLTVGMPGAQEARGVARGLSLTASDPVGVQPTESPIEGKVAQEPVPQLLQEPEAQTNGGLLVFIDCHRMICDMDYLRRQITFINYVRDRKDAQVHVLATARQSGAGWEITFDFIGLKEFEGDDVSHIYMASNTDIADETREGVAQVLRVGVLHYLVRTPLIKQVEIRQEVQQIEERFLVVDPADDPWNFWVFRIGIFGAVSGEDRRSNRHVDSDISAIRTTEEWKLRFNGNVRYDDRKFILNDGSESFALTRQISLRHQTVKSLGDHWGASFKAAILQATFVNQNRTWGFLPGIEYNFFPYAESSRRSFTITYEVGAVNYDYIEKTIFGETSEWLYDHALQTDFTVVQPWGEAEFSIETAQFLSELSQWRLVLDGRLQFRIVRGLDFNVRGSWASIRDQRYLPAGGQTDEEILLEQQALATNSRYSISCGISYTFGSIFNNVVNPRFTGSRYGFSRFF